MFGLRSQYALSTYFVAEMRQNMHFAYVQDDIRNVRSTHGERGPSIRVRDTDVGNDNHLTNYDPVSTRF